MSFSSNINITFLKENFFIWSKRLTLDIEVEDGRARVGRRHVCLWTGVSVVCELGNTAPTRRDLGPQVGADVVPQLATTAQLTK